MIPARPALGHALELLAPAKTAEIGIEAINHGADAVYIGGPSFGARANAGNTVADIERLVRHAHRFGAQIFVTLNTVLRDDELEPASRMIEQVYEAGADALIVQDMGLLELDLPPIQLHASTQCDIRTPEKARFLQDVGFSQIVLARELTLAQIAEIAQTTRCTLEFFIHGALCVAYSGQCYISHAHTGRSANRGDCSQACRLPYNVTDGDGRFVAYEQHVLSLKDNNQSANLRALIEAGIRSFKIEGRYKDLGYVKNITAHYRQLLDQIIDAPDNAGAGRRASSGRTTFFFTPNPDKNFNRGATDYFVNGRQIDIGAFESPKHIGLPIGYVARIGPQWFELESTEPLHNGDGFTYATLQRDIVGFKANRVEPIDVAQQPAIWRVYPKEAIASLKDLRTGVEMSRNGDHAWEQQLTKTSSDRRIAVQIALAESPHGFVLTLTDEDGHVGMATLDHPKEPAQQAERAQAALREHLSKLGATIFSAQTVSLQCAQAWFLPASAINTLRREAVAALETAREHARLPPSRAPAIEPPVPYPEDSLSYLANVLNHKARDFYARHGVRVIAAAYEAHEERGDVSLMITKHCVRYSLSLCPKQAKGVQGVQGTIRAEPLSLINGKERLTLRFDCKRCEMHVVGKIKPSVLNAAAGVPITVYRTRPLPHQPA